MVFRKNYYEHKRNENELIDSFKRYIVGAGINTRDYKERIPALLKAGADILCMDSSDGGIVHDYHIILALAMGADFIMLGRYFARFNESPSKKVNINGNYMKEYWGEGSARARNWQRYDTGGESKMSFVEGVDSYVPYAGSLKDNITLSMDKVRSTMCNCGCLNISDLQKNAKITLVSSTSIKDSLSKYPELKERMQSLLQNGEKITPKQRKAEIQSLQSEYDSIGKEQTEMEGGRNLM